VWTKKGQEFIKKMIQGNKYKEKEINKKNNKDYDKSFFV
jgi:hypothetical protein